MAQTTSRRCIDPLSTDTVGGTVTGTTETAFVRKLKIPARELGKGFIAKFGGAVIATSTNSTDTLTIKAYIGTGADNTGLLVAASTAVDVANNDVGAFEGFAKCKLAGGASTGILVGKSDTVLKTTASLMAFDAVEAQLDFAADMYLVVTATWSVSSASNSCRLDDLWLEIYPQDVQPS